MFPSEKWVETLWFPLPPLEKLRTGSLASVGEDAQRDPGQASDLIGAVLDPAGLLELVALSTLLRVVSTQEASV